MGRSIASKNLTVKGRHLLNVELEKWEIKKRYFTLRVHSNCLFDVLQMANKGVSYDTFFKLTILMLPAIFQLDTEDQFNN